MKSKIAGVDFIKFFSFFTIFLLHIEKISYFSTNNIARLGVYLFMVLSGFLMMYNYESKFEKTSLSVIIKFVKIKIMKFYPLFIIGLIIKIPVSLLRYYYEYGGIVADFVTNSLLRFFSSIFLIQAFIPNQNYNFAFNGVSWFLDVLIFCYLFTPLFIKIIKKNTYKKNIITLFIIIFLQLIFQMIIDKYVQNDFWYYIFPPYRLFDYFIGMLLCYILTTNENFHIDSIQITYTAYEIIFIVIVIISYLFDLFNCNEYTYILTILFLCVFIQNKGFISRKLNACYFVKKIASVNLELFLLHQPIIKYIEFITSKIKYNSIFLNTIMSIMTFLVVYIFCELVHRFLPIIFDKKWGKKNGQSTKKKSYS